MCKRISALYDSIIPHDGTQPCYQRLGGSLWLFEMIILAPGYFIVMLRYVKPVYFFFVSPVCLFRFSFLLTVAFAFAIPTLSKYLVDR